MRKLKKDEMLTCIYCGEEQEFPAIDYIAHVPNLFGVERKDDYQHSVDREQCCSCDEYFFLRLNNKDEIIVANNPEACYQN